MWQARIEVVLAILVGKPVINGTRLAVGFLLDLMAEVSQPADQILRNYPQLNADDLQVSPPSRRRVAEAGSSYSLAI